MAQHTETYKEFVERTISELIDRQIEAYEREDYERCAELQEGIDEYQSMLPTLRKDERQ